MSDQRLGDLERRFRETGAVEDEARWLRALVAADEKTRWQLELAADLGDPAARAAAGDRPALPDDDLARWPQLIAARWGGRVGVRMAIAGARVALANPLSYSRRNRTLAGILADCDRWIEQPTPEGASAIYRATHRFGEPQGPAALPTWTLIRIGVFLRYGSTANLGFTLQEAAEWLVAKDAGTDEAEARRTVRERVRAEVLAWALEGRHDPVSDPEPLIARALSHLADGDIEGARATADRVLALEPGSARAATLAGRVALAAGDPAAAIAAVEPIIGRTLGSPEPLRVRGLARLAAGDRAGALADLSDYAERVTVRITMNGVTEERQGPDDEVREALRALGAG